MSPLIDLDGVGIRLGGRPVLRGVQLSIGSGQVAEVTGPNGSGKTTLLRLLATLARPNEGSGTLFDKELGSPEVRTVRERIGFITHQPALIDELTLAENLHHFARIRGVDPERCDRALDIVGLKGSIDRRVGDSSFGMRRRAEIAWQLVAKPDLLLLDEARSGLDSEARDLISALVGSTVERGGAAVVVSHESTGIGAEREVSAYRLLDGRLEPVS